MTALEPLLGTADVARLLGVPVKTVLTWRYKGVGPPGFRVGKHVRYRRGDIEQYINALVDAERAVWE